MIRTLLLEKDKIRQTMTDLWKQREGGKSWTDDQKKTYDSLSERAKALDKDIKLRAEYEKTMEDQKPIADKKFDQFEKRASIVNLLKRAVFEQTKSSELEKSFDKGAIDEIVQERNNRYPEFAKPGAMYLRSKDLMTPMKKRADLTTASNSGGDLIQPSLYDSIVPNLFEQSWTGRAGVKMVSGWKGKFLLPKEKDKPASAFVSEASSYPESSMTYDNALELSPLKCGTIQKVTLQELLQEEHDLLEGSILSQLLKDFAQKTDDLFLTGNGVAPNPKGVFSYTGIQSKELGVDGNNGGELTFDDCKDIQTLIEETDQTLPPVWVINSKTAGYGRKKLRSSTANSRYLIESGMLADMRMIISNILKSNLQKGTSTANLSEALCFIPSSFIMVQWAEPQISMDTKGDNFEKDLVSFKVSSYLNAGVAREKDFVRVRHIDTA